MFEAILTGVVSGIVAGVIVAIVQFFLVRWLNKRMELIKRIKMMKCPKCGREGVYDLDLKRDLSSCAFCGYIFPKSRKSQNLFFYIIIKLSVEYEIYE